MSVYVYASVRDFLCIALLLPFILGFCLSFFVFFFNYLKEIFVNNYFYFNNFILFYFLLFLFFLFYSELCGGQALSALARRQGCASEVGKPTSGHWSTRDLPAPHNIKWQKSPRDLHLNTKTQLPSTTSKLQCWTPYAKQLARQEENPIH